MRRAFFTSTVIVWLLIIGVVIFLAERYVTTPTLDFRGRTDLHLGMRNNNFGNITAPSANYWKGQVGLDDTHDPGYAVFATMNDGARASAINLYSYVDKDGANTPNLIAQRWSPSSDNNTPANKAGLIADALGIGVDDTVDLNGSSMPQALKAIAVDEVGQDQADLIPDSVYKAAWLEALAHKA